MNPTTDAAVADPAARSADFRRVGRAIAFLEERAREQPSLDDVAAHVGLSPFHFQRLFRRFAGVSPKRFVQFLTAEHAKRLLRESRTVLDTTFDVGLSGPGRLHDLFVSVEAVTPGQYKSRGRGLDVRYGFHPTPFGTCLLATTDRGICNLWFTDRGDDVAVLEREWAGARLREDASATAGTVERIFDSAGGAPLPLLLRGTNFQIKVWQALLRIPAGAVVSYGDLARRLGMPTSARAVAGAVARNPISYVVPCHRVLRRSGALGGYRWDPVRKRALLAVESASAAS